MSDERLRELERRWRESGTVEDEAACLRERVRVGDLTQDRLELAGYCGSEAARLALPDGPGDPLDSFRLLDPGVMCRWGFESIYRFALAGMRFALARHERSITDARIRRVVDAVEAFVVADPDRSGHFGEQAIRLAVGIDTDLLLAGQNWRPELLPPSPMRELADAAARIGLFPGDDRPSLACSAPPGWLEDEDERWVGSNEALAAGEVETIVNDLVSVLAEEPVEFHAAAEVVVWALGYSDPVRERVEARRAGGEG